MANINDVYQFRVLTSVPSQIGINVLSYVVTNKVGTGCTDSQAAIAFDTAIAATYKGVMSPNATYRGVGARRVSPPPTGIEATTIANLGVGTLGANLMPTQTAGLISWKTNTAGRKGRGRIYVAFPPISAANADGSPSNVYLAALTALNNAIPFIFTPGVGGNTNTFQLCLRNKVSGMTTVVTVANVISKWATQRRRGMYGRTNVPPF